MSINQNLEPLVYYRDILQPTHEKVVDEFIKYNLTACNADLKKNRDVAQEVYKLEKELKETNKLKKRQTNLIVFYSLLIGLFVCGIIASIIVMVLLDLTWPVLLAPIMTIIFGVIIIAISIWRIVALNKKVKNLKEIISKLEIEITTKKEICYKEVWKFLYAIPYAVDKRLIEKAFPDIEFDDYFSMVDETIWENWNELKMDKQTMVRTIKSGMINKTPFLLTSLTKQEWHDITYSGSRTFSYTSRDSKGNLTTHTAIVYAYYNHPAPFYPTQTLLSFLSGITKKGEFMNFDSLKKQNDVSKFYEKNSKQFKNMRPMENIEFDRLFPCVRSDEIEFKSIFTPYTQEKMVELLQNNSYNYIKKNETSFIVNNNFKNFDLKVYVDNLNHFDIDEVVKNFKNFHLGLFDKIYNIFLPLLSIPLYQREKFIDVQDKKNENHISRKEIESLIDTYVSYEYFKLPSAGTKFIHKITSSKKGKAKDIDWSLHVVEHNSFRPDRLIKQVSVHDSRVGNVIIPVDYINYIPLKSQNLFLYFHDNSCQINREEDYDKWFEKQTIISENNFSDIETNLPLKRRWAFGAHNLFLFSVNNFDQLDSKDIEKFVSNIVKHNQDLFKKSAKELKTKVEKNIVDNIKDEIREVEFDKSIDDRINVVALAMLEEQKRSNKSKPQKERT